MENAPMVHPFILIQTPAAPIPVIGLGDGNAPSDIILPPATPVANPDKQYVNDAIMAGHARTNDKDNDVNQKDFNFKDFNPDPRPRP
jgi:hypothetical protein